MTFFCSNYLLSLHIWYLLSDQFHQLVKREIEIIHLKMPYPSAMTTRVDNPRLRLLNMLRNDSRPIMTFMGLPSFRTAQVVALTGVDVSKK